jgi:hypothetical protein
MATVPFALHFTGDIDPLAVATFVLALVTLAAVVIAARALQVSQRNDDRWRAHVDNDQRPVVVPVHHAVQMPLYQGHGELLVPVENIGAGPALDLNLYVTPRDQNGSVSPAWGEIKHTGATAGPTASPRGPGSGSNSSQLIVEIVALGRLDRIRLDVVVGVRLARAAAARRRVRLLAERRAVRVGRVAWVVAALVRVRPLGRVGFPDRVVELVVRVALARLVVAFVAHV